MRSLFSSKSNVRKQNYLFTKLLCHFISHLLCLAGLRYGKMIGSGKQCGGLYYLCPLQRTPVSHQVSYHSNLWRMLFGYPSPSRLILVSSLLPLNNISFDDSCNVCPMTKQTRIPFPLRWNTQPFY